MKKFLSMLLVLTMLFSLSAPALAAGPNEVYDELEGVADSKVTLQVINTCTHGGSHWKDNGDGTHDEVCTGCGEVLTDHEPHVDDDDDDICDKCGSDLNPGCKHPGSNWIDNHDGTHDEVCTGCGEVLTDDEPHVDVNGDYVCDKCEAELERPGCGHDKGTHWVDNENGTHDEICNGCGEVVTDDEEHIDADGDYVCDKCEAELERPGCGHDKGTHWVDNKDGTHDEICNGCGEVLTDDEEHIDEDGDKVCDKCGALIPNQGPVLIATVPLKLPIVMDLKGNVTVPDNAVVQNHVANRAIAVTDITLNPGSEWVIGSMSDDFNEIEPDSKVLALSFRHDTHDNSGVFDLTAGNWNVGAADVLKLNMAAKVPVQTKASSESEIADVEFVLNWAEDLNAASSDAGTGAGDQDEINAGVIVTKPVEPDDEEFVASYDSGTLLVGGSKDVTLSWSGYSEPVEFESVVASEPDIVSFSEVDSGENTKTLAVNGLKLGETEVTAKLSNGDATTFTAKVSEISDESEIQVNMPDTDLEPGSTISTGDVEIKIPVTNPDGTTGEITCRPEIDAALAEGDNKFEFDVFFGGRVIHVSYVLKLAASGSTVTILPSENGNTGDVTEIKTDGAYKISEYPETYPDAGYMLDHWVNSKGNIVDDNTIFSDGDSIRPVFVLKPIQDFVITKTNRAEIGYTGVDGEVLEIPAEFIGSDGNRYRPIGFADLSMNSSQGLKSIIMPDTITYIGNSALCNCQNLETVQFSNNLRSIGSNAFSSCYKLQSVTLPESVTSIDYAAFASTRALKSINIPKNITKIPNNMLSGSGITSFTIPSWVTELGTGCFSGSALESITIPSSVTKIGDSAFTYTDLQTLSLPNSVTEIGNYMCQNCYSLTSIKLSSSLQNIPLCAFSDCKLLSGSLSLSSSVKTIGSNAFYNCYGLNLTVPSGVTSIGSYAFNNVSHVTYRGSATDGNRVNWGAASFN